MTKGKSFRFTSKITKDFNRSTFTELRRRLKLDEAEVRVGLPAGKLHKDRASAKGRGKGKGASQGTPLAVIGAAHEFGVPGRIPERPWLRPGIRSGTEDYTRLNRVNLIRIIKGEINGAQALRMLGVMAVGKVQKYIRNGAFVPLAQSTIDRKGSSQPLIDTGQMIQSVTFEVGKKDSND